MRRSSCAGRYAKMSAYDQGRAQAHLRRFKNNYVINNNGARNAALRDGKGRAKWVLPWDGNCFLTAQAWSEIVTAGPRPALPEILCRADGANHRQRRPSGPDPTGRCRIPSRRSCSAATAPRNSTRRITTAAGRRWSFSTASASGNLGPVQRRCLGPTAPGAFRRCRRLWARPAGSRGSSRGRAQLESEGKIAMRARGRPGSLASPGCSTARCRGDETAIPRPRRSPATTKMRSRVCPSRRGHAGATWPSG
jgi:hypothetical protein